MKRILAALVLAVYLLPILAYAHRGNTDSNGGHTDSSTGEYHYHHGYEPHDHWDMDGDGEVDCPFLFDDKTGLKSGSSSSGGSYIGSSVGYSEGYDDGWQKGYQKGYFAAQHEYIQKLRETRKEASIRAALITLAVVIPVGLLGFYTYLRKSRKQSRPGLKKSGQKTQTSNKSDSVSSIEQEGELDINSIITILLVLVTGALLVFLCFQRDPHSQIGFRGFGDVQLDLWTILGGIVGYLFVAWFFGGIFWVCLYVLVVAPVIHINAEIKKIPKKAEIPGQDHGVRVAQYCTIAMVIMVTLLYMFGFIG